MAACSPHHHLDAATFAELGVPQTSRIPFTFEYNRHSRLARVIHSKCSARGTHQCNRMLTFVSCPFERDVHRPSSPAWAGLSPPLLSSSISQAMLGPYLTSSQRARNSAAPAPSRLLFQDQLRKPVSGTLFFLKKTNKQRVEIEHKTMHRGILRVHRHNHGSLCQKRVAFGVKMHSRTVAQGTVTGCHQECCEDTTCLKVGAVPTVMTRQALPRLACASIPVPSTPSHPQKVRPLLLCSLTDSRWQ